MAIILATLIVSLVLAFVLGSLLGIFNKVFYVKTDETVAEIRAVLPSANCGGCGYPGCDGCAVAMAAGEAPVTACTAGGPAVAEAVGKIMGVTASVESKIAVLLCHGAIGKAEEKAVYGGVKSCRASVLAGTGTKMCEYGCIGYGDCEVVCAFDALVIGKNGLPEIDASKCTGCNMCVTACPQNILALFPASEAGALVFCSCHSMKKNMLLKNCKAACIKCAKCARVCHVNAIVMDSVTGLPVVDRTICDSCGACVEACPTKIISLVENQIRIAVPSAVEA